jgi:hypothetical protein
MSHDDFEFEPIPGLPAMLPAGEDLLWQGSPDWKALAIRAYHVRKVGLYFLALIAWRIGIGINGGQTFVAMAQSCALLAGLGITAMAVLSLLAYWTSRATVYSITSRRVLLRHGIAVPLTLNVPFIAIESAALKSYPDGTGDIALTVERRQRVGYLITWPHLRPGYVTHPAPSFRVLPDAARAAEILSVALAAYAGTDPVRITAADQPSTNGFRPRTAATA